MKRELAWKAPVRILATSGFSRQIEQCLSRLTAYYHISPTLHHRIRRLLYSSITITITITIIVIISSSSFS